MNRSPEFPPDFGDPESEPAATTLERHHLLAELSRNRQEWAQRLASAEVAAQPELIAMLGRLIEGGPEMSPSERAHLRRMIAIGYSFYAYLQESFRAEVDQELHSMVAAHIQAELDELGALAGAEVTTEWDAAYRDLQQFYGDPVGDPIIDAISDTIDTMRGDPETPN